MIEPSDDFFEERRCLLEPIPEIFKAAFLLDCAVGAHLAGNMSEAEKLLRAADIQEVRNWTKSIWGSTTEEIHRIRVTNDSPQIIPKDERVSVRMPNKEKQNAIIRRDGYHCRFCGIPVIRPEIRKAIVRFYPDTVSWGRKEHEQHAAFQCMRLQYDHLVPHSRGGSNSSSNIIITCAACNFGKDSFLLEELGLRDPREKYRLQSNWDGLERFLG